MGNANTGERGPLSDAELAMIRRRLAGHEECVPRCDRAPSGETARMLATIDAQREFIEKGLAAYNEKALALCNDIGARQLRYGAKTMRDACAALLRATANNCGLAALADILRDHAAAIDCLALPDGPSDCTGRHVAPAGTNAMTDAEIGDLRASVATILDKGALFAKPNAVLRSRGGESLGFDWIADVTGDSAEAWAYATLFANAPRLLVTADAKRTAHDEMSPAPGARGAVIYRGDGVMVCHVTLEPGASWPEETHADHVETVTAVAGCLAAEGITWAAFDSGFVGHVDRAHGFAAARIAAGRAHTIRNVSATEPAEYISMLRRA